MQEIFIYGGIAVNVIGAIFLMAYAVKYTYAFNKSKNRPIETNTMKPQWAKKRAIGFCLMIMGAMIAIIGCIM